LDGYSYSSLSSLIVISDPINYEKLLEETEENGYEPWRAYGRSKLANIIFTYELHKRLREEGITNVTVNALHPGLVATQLLTKAGWNNAGMPVADGAKTSIYLASDPEVANRSGEYWFECKPEESTPVSHSPEEGKKLWKYSLEWTGLANK